MNAGVNEMTFSATSSGEGHLGDATLLAIALAVERLRPKPRSLNYLKINYLIT
jgi:hypothetical protein